MSKWSHFILWPVWVIWSAMAEEWLLLVSALKCSVFLSCNRRFVFPIYFPIYCIIDSTGRLYPKKEQRVSGKGIRCADLRYVKGAALFMDGIWEDCLPPSKQQKVYRGASVLKSCGSLTLWNYPGIAPDLSWAGKEWLVGREKCPKGQYGSVKLQISNRRKISALKANKPLANKTPRAGRKICVL